MERVREPELMDRPEVDPGQLHRSLADLAIVNLFLGGRHTVVRLVLDLAAERRRSPVTILDVATGGADIPRRLVTEARRRSLALEVTASDLHATTLNYAAAVTADYSEIRVAAADALALPFPDGSYDIVTNSTTLHHFERDDAITALSEMTRVAKTAVVVTDLARSRPALLGAKLLAWTLWRNHPITRHDGPVSVRAAFTPVEITEMAREATDAPFEVRRHPLFRLSLVIRTDGARGP